MSPATATLRRLLTRFRTAGASPQAAALDAGGAATVADSHLVMNALNQLAASMHTKVGEEDPRLFALADYLRLVFRCGLDEMIPVNDEFLLLQSYVQLVARNRLIDITFEFSPGSAAASDNLRLVRRHLACDLVGAILRALPGERARQARLCIGFEGASQSHAYLLRASLVHPDGQAFEARLRKEIDAYAGSGAIPPLLQTYAHSAEFVTWSVAVAGVTYPGGAE